MDKPEDCIAVLEEAAKFFEVTERPDLAARTVAWAQGVAAENPEALRRLTLTRAQWAGRDRRWRDAIAILGSGFADQPSTVEFLQACVMATQANLKLGDIDNANRLFQKTFGLVGSVELAAGERANYYVGLSRMAQDAEWRRKLLEQARTSLEGAGLDLVANSVDQEFAALALQSPAPAVGLRPAAAPALVRRQHHPLPPAYAGGGAAGRRGTGA